jgi:hypothetical protein
MMEVIGQHGGGATGVQPVKMTVSAQNVIETLRRAKGLGTRLKSVQDKLAALQKESQRAIDDEDDVYTDDLKQNMAGIQTKIGLAKTQHSAILENIHDYQSKHQQLGTLNTQLRSNPELRQAALDLRLETDELLRFVVQQTVNLENIVSKIEQNLEALSPASADWLPDHLSSWKENVPLLYDTLITYNLDFHAYACAWGGRLTDSSWKNSRFSFQKLYISRSPSEKAIETGTPCTLDILHTKLPSLRVFDEKKLISGLDPRRRSQVPYKSRLIHPGPVNRMLYVHGFLFRLLLTSFFSLELFQCYQILLFLFLLQVILYMFGIPKLSRIGHCVIPHSQTMQMFC